MSCIYIYIYIYIYILYVGMQIMAHGAFNNKIFLVVIKYLGESAATQICSSATL